MEINSFQNEFTKCQNHLKSYLYRLLADKNDAEDISQDTYLKALDKILQFKGESSFKTWIFQIATNLAYDELRKRKRWQIDAQDKTRALARDSHEIKAEFMFVHNNSLYGNYEIKEHIDFCFTCLAKTLVIEHQLALLLKDIYDFSVKEIALIMNCTEGVVKHLLVDARKTMITIFDNRCALVSKKGACHQCSELNGFFNPKHKTQQAVAALDLMKASKKVDKKELYNLRTSLIKFIDPLNSEGYDLHAVIMKYTKIAIREKE